MLLFSSGEKNNQKIVDGNLKLKVIMFQKNLPQFFINNDFIATRTIMEDDFLMFEAGKKLAKKGAEVGKKGLERAKEIREHLRPPQKD